MPIPKLSQHNKQGHKLKVDEKEITTIQSYKHPIFCLKNIHKDFDLDKCDDSEKKEFSELLIMLGKLDWIEIQKRDKYKGGSEKIPIKSLKVSVPKFITPDVDSLLVVRKQNKMLLIGHRNRFIFHVLFIDPKLKTYKH
jgi:hypothetical protein